MDQFQSTMVLDSQSPEGERISTLQLRYPRFIHPEFLTHRVFSRGSSSSRAIPVQKLIAQVRSNPAMPVHWGSNKPGMQAGEEIMHVNSARAHWIIAANNAADQAEALMNLGLHKQVANRLLEPFVYIHTIVTATDWDNFFDLRLAKAADPTMQALARAMKATMDASTPVERDVHLPYIEYHQLHPLDEFPLVSAARCARVSYLNHDGTNPDWDKDLDLAKRLLQDKHMSPFEHIATFKPGRHANLNGWESYRSQIGA